MPAEGVDRQNTLGQAEGSTAPRNAAGGCVAGTV
jgi:hypothetical protein